MKLSSMHHHFSKERNWYTYIFYDTPCINLRVLINSGGSQCRRSICSYVVEHARVAYKSTRYLVRDIRNVALCLPAGCKLIIARINYAVWRSRARSPRHTCNLLTVHTLRGKSAHSSSTRYNFSVICRVTLFRRIARTLQSFTLGEFLEKTEIPFFFS